MDSEASRSTTGSDPRAQDERVLEGSSLELPYVPDFLVDDLRLWFVPSRRDVRAVYHELVGESAKNWASYYTKKGWKFLHQDTEREGPYAVRGETVRLEILEPGRIFAPRPRFRFEPGGEPYPVVSLEKRRPINPWKPTYIRSLAFIKRYRWPHPTPRSVMAAIWEIEECGEIPGSTSWMNAEHILVTSDADKLEETLADIFYNRPEDFPLGSKVYLRVLGRLGPKGFRTLANLAKHPITRKRIEVARALGELGELGKPGKPEAVETLLLLLDDEDPTVREVALRSLGKVGVPQDADPEGKVRAQLEAPEIANRVWAAEALLAGGDESQRKYLIQLVKEEKRPLADLGELGEVLVESGVVEAVPYLIQRLKDGRAEVSMDAAEVLARLTGLDIHLSAEPDAEERRVAIKSFNRWWEDRKRERSAQRQKK